ncbi:ATP-binding cassette domain-containing protein, partial [Streptomyces umbrinus]
MKLEIDDIRVGYHRSLVLHGVSVDVPDDGVAAVLGHNGAGKSTLLRAAVGLLTPSSGAIRLDGE